METEQQLSHEETVRILRNWYTVGDRIERHLIAVKQGTIVGFGKKYIPRGGFDHKRAGVYMDFFTLRIQSADGSEWSQNLGEPLSDAALGSFRFRVGDYRVIFDIDNNKKTIIILAVGNRKDIYR